MEKNLGVLTFFCSIPASIFAVWRIVSDVLNGSSRDLLSLYWLLPLLACMALAANIRLPSPLGQIPPLMDAILVYWWAFRIPLATCFTITAVLKWRAVHLGVESDKYLAVGWTIVALTTVASVWKGRNAARRVRESFALPTTILDPPRPRRPLLCNIHPYFFRFYDDAPGCTIQRIHLEASFIDVWQGIGSESSQGKASKLFFFVHGGGWKSGHARMNCWGPLLQALAARGWLVVSCEYRTDKWPHHLEDCKAGLDYVLNARNCLVLDTDTLNLVISGGSAGGHLATLLVLFALQQGHSVHSSVLFYPALDPRDSSGFTLRSPCASPCCGLQYGQSLLRWFFESKVLHDHDEVRWTALDEDCPDPYQILQSLTQSHKELFPRTLIVHGVEDSLVPIEFSTSWLGTLEALPGGASQGHQLVTVAGARHSFEVAPGLFHCLAIDAVIDGVVAWLEG